MKKYSTFKIMAGLFAISLSGLLSGCGSTNNLDLQPAMEVQAASGAAQNRITVRGTVESTERRNIYSTLSLFVDQIHVQEGDQITKGHVLAALDSEDLQLTIAQQRASLESARQNSQNTVSETQRMLDEATANLANNRNIHILSAEAALSAAAANLETARANYDNAHRDYTNGTNPQVLTASSFFTTARVESERIQTNHTNLTALYAGGIISSEEMRQSENALTHARNQYNDARIAYDNAIEMQQRTLQQLRIASGSAQTAHHNAQELLSASRIAAQQEIERLRSNANSAEISANLEPMEMALQLLERQLEDAVITSPISGTVTNVVAREGAMGLGLLFVVEDTDNLRIMARFREYDIVSIYEGMEVGIVSDGAGSTEYAGVITRISPAAVMSGSSVVEFEVEIAVVSSDTDLRIGMGVRVEVDFG